MIFAGKVRVKRNQKLEVKNPFKLNKNIYLKLAVHMQKIDFNTGWREIEPVILKLHRILDTERTSEENV